MSTSIIKLLKISLIITLMSFITGCGYIPHDVTIKPELSVQAQNIGKGKTLSVEVRDDRDSQDIGYRTVTKTGRITLDKKQDLVAVIKTSIEEGFETLNFQIVQATGKRHVKVDIRLIEYESVWGFFTAGAMNRATFKVVCTSPSGKKFENTYRIEHEHRYFFLPFKATNKQWINEAVSDAIMRLFNDKDLISFLASE